MEVVPSEDPETVYIKMFKNPGDKKFLDEKELQLICDNMDMHVKNMVFKPNFKNKHTDMIGFLEKRVQVGSPTKIKTGLFGRKKTPVITLKLGIDTLM